MLKPHQLHYGIVLLPLAKNYFYIYNLFNKNLRLSKLLYLYLR